MSTKDCRAVTQASHTTWRLLMASQPDCVVQSVPKVRLNTQHNAMDAKIQGGERDAQ